MRFIPRQNIDVVVKSVILQQEETFIRKDILRNRPLIERVGYLKEVFDYEQPLQQCRTNNIFVQVRNLMVNRLIKIRPCLDGNFFRDVRRLSIPFDRIEQPSVQHFKIEHE